jgi:hypothetical protein
MDFDRAFGADDALMTQGVDVRFGADCWITLRHAGPTNRAYQAALTDRVAKNWSAFNGNGHDRLAEQERIAQEVYADLIVVSWRGVELKGAALPYNRDNVLKLLRAYPVVWERVQAEASRLSNFQKEASDAAGKS